MKRQAIWIVIIVVLALILLVIFAGVGRYILRLREESQEMADLTKEALTEQFDNLNTQYDGVKITLRNDSLIAQLESEQLKVQEIQEELRKTKAADARKILALKKELETLRTIMRSYVAQIDSLDRLNKHLMQENEVISGRYRQATQTVSQLSTEKEKLTETVQIAAKLDASNLNVRGLDKKNKATNKLKKMEKLEVNFTINKNITAPTGEKDIYIRILKPDDDVLVKNPNNVFPFENKNIAYSAKRPIEYTGEETPLSIYWEIEETLLPGTYRVDVFADGNRIGHKSFQLEN
ncbi:hypothetical protein AGMMS49965_24780 [Bacteroidia bacterium]|nr:hypothetical protein AGMMS49965_24780 [Bacteroidia bacterium]